MNKHIVAASLCLISTTAMAQNYNFPYSYQTYQNQNNFNNQIEQVEEFEDVTYYENTQGIKYQEAPAEKNWKLSLMVGSHYSAEYKGSKNSKLETLILPTAEYRLDPWQKLYLSMDKGAGYAFSLTENLEIGTGLGYRQGRDEKDTAFLAGMGDVDDTLTYLTYADYKFYDYKFGIKLEKGADSSNDGLTTEFSAGYMTVLNPQLILGAKITAIYADDTYMKQNFGVTSAQAVAGRTEFKADAGFAEAKAKVYTNYNIAGPHNITTAIGYSQLLGDAKKSSITQDASDISLAVGYAYKF